MSTDEPTPDDPEPDDLELDAAERYRLDGVAALADRPVDGRRVALVLGVAALVVAAATAGAAELLLEGANVEPEGADRLRALATDGPTPWHSRGHVAVVLVDGLRVDEARAMRSWDRLRERSTTGTVQLRVPTLSRPFYHHLFTGVPSDVSGVRTNRFVDHARFDSVTDRVRAAGGRVFIAADGLDWMRRMHGRDGDGGSDAPGALDAPLDETLARWRAADPPALLIVHFVDTDATAHASGVRSDAHRRAVDAADALVGRIADAETATLFLLSDHGHRDAGGHGGDEPEVAFSPLLVRAPGVTRGARIPVPIDPDTLAPSIALALGVPRPRAALGEALSELVGDAPADPWPLRAGSIAHAIREHARRMLSSRREWLVPVLGLLVFALLGPIKRGFGFDRSLLAVPLGPALVVAGHLAIGPLSLSAIDERGAHAARVVALGALACLVAIGVARALGRGAPEVCTRRAAALAGWSAFASVAASLTWCGFALGPWPLSPRAFYAPLLACGAGVGALVVAGVALLVSVARDRSRSAASRPTART